MLGELKRQGILLAVASNKYHEATVALIPAYFGEGLFDFVFGQREGIPIKPDPTIVYDIIKAAGVRKEEVLYVGDSGVDMQTAIHAGVTSCGVTWGFRPRAELETFHPNYIIDKAEEVLEIVFR